MPQKKALFLLSKPQRMDTILQMVRRLKSNQLLTLQHFGLRMMSLWSHTGFAPLRHRRVPSLFLPLDLDG